MVYLHTLSLNGVVIVKKHNSNVKHYPFVGKGEYTVSLSRSPFLLGCPSGSSDIAKNRLHYKLCTEIHQQEDDPETSYLRLLHLLCLDFYMQLTWKLCIYGIHSVGKLTSAK